MNLADEEAIDAAIVSLDFEKAFNGVEMKAVQGCMKYFNFGVILIS